MGIMVDLEESVTAPRDHDPLFLDALHGLPPYIYIHMYVCIYIYICTCLYTHICIYICYIYIHNIYMYIYT